MPNARRPGRNPHAGPAAPRFVGPRVLVATLVRMAVLVVAVAAGGCAVAGAMAERIEKVTPVPAKYTLKKVPTVILVENYDNAALNAVDSQRLAQRIEQALVAKEVAPIVPVQAVRDLYDKDRTAFRSMTIPQIGTAVGAQQVIYVNVTKMSAETDATSSLARASGAVQVRVIDIASGETLWPKDNPDGYPIVHQSKWDEIQPNQTPEQVMEPVYANISMGVATLFFEYMRPA